MNARTQHINDGATVVRLIIRRTATVSTCHAGAGKGRISQLPSVSSGYLA